ncbi:uncharacterized protein J5M81_011266 [Pluvialis apricaria]
MNKLLQDLAREREGHHSELQEMLEQWQKEKAETEGEHAKALFDVKQKVATMAAQLKEERTRVDHAKQEHITGKLQAELQEAQSAIQAVEKRHKGEISAMREEMQILHQQRDALQKEQERDRRQAVKEKLDWEIKLLQQSVTASETRANAAPDMNHCRAQELHTTPTVLKIKSEEEEIRGLWEDLQRVQQTLTKKDDEIKSQRDRVRSLEKTLARREQELRRQSELLKQLTSALRWKGDDETLKKQLQKLRKWEEEEAEKRKVLCERDHLLQRQKELTQQLEDERKAKQEAAEQ